MERGLHAVALAAAFIGLLGYAHAATFDERFSDTMLDKSNPPLGSPHVTPTPEIWGIKVLLLIGGKLAHSIDYGDKTYATGEECKAAALADESLLSSGQAAQNAAVQQFGDTAAIAIVCAMELQ